MSPEETAEFHGRLLELGDTLVALGATVAVLLAILAGVALVRAVWS